MWPFNKKQIASTPVHDDRDDNLMPIPQEKNFDWAHYQAISHGGIHVGYQDEFDLVPTTRVLKSLYAKEPWISFTCNAISRQFMNSKLVLVKKTSFDGDDEQVISNHPLLNFMGNVGIENPAFFTSNNIIDLILTGNAYVWLAPDLKDKKRLPSERVDMKFADGRLKEYYVTNPDSSFSSSGLTLQPDEVLHFLMPNPYSPWVGMSLFMAINLPVLIDKYGREFIIGFFLRGGQTTGIIQTDATNADQLTRFVKTIMQAIGGRRNAHGDKVLPKGATWAASGSSMSDIQLSELLKDNQTLFRAATGTTNTVLGISEGVNRATAMAEMENFWKMTILPLQYIYCAAIKHSSLWKRFGLDDSWSIRFDNSHVEYLDDFGRKLDEDAKLAPVATVNERRERLGYDSMERLGDKLESEMKPVPTLNPLGFSLPTELIESKTVESEQIEHSTEMSEIGKIKAELPALQDPTIRADSYFQREFARWEDITLAHMSDLEKAQSIIEERATQFAAGLSDILLPHMMKVYDYHLSRLVKSKCMRTKDEQTDKDRQAKLDELRARGKRVLKGTAFENAKQSFVGYSNTNMKRIHGGIAEELDSGKNFDDVAKYVRETFGEFYEGQAKTIVRTEYASAMAAANQQFGNDLATVSKKTKKTWVTMDDEFTRKDHLVLDGAEIVGNADEVPDMYFNVKGEPYLRYPKDEKGEAGAVINCRCDLIWEVVEWENK